MIYESHYWKDDLLKRADSLAKRANQRRWPDASLAKIEQDVMLIAYSTRKLMEAGKLSNQTAATAVPVSSYAAIGKPVHRMNWHRLDELYDVANPSATSISVKDLCNQIIHSYVFVVSAGENGLEGFLVASDRDRNKRLLDVSLPAFLDTVRIIGTDFPNSVSWTWDTKLGDYAVDAKNEPRP
ncbi:MAG: hypothetical protein K8H88_34345 [Sandaracinaceae bacterium]|nr:hypothetical protein [Sandaracinaceae bacterium]